VLPASSGGGIRYPIGSIIESSDPSDRATVGEPAYRSVDAPDAAAESEPITVTSALDAPDRSIVRSPIESSFAVRRLAPLSVASDVVAVPERFARDAPDISRCGHGV